LGKNENPNQGSFIVEALTDLVEEAVLKEFEAIAERGGVLGRDGDRLPARQIQEDSMLYEHRKHDGSYPIIGVNTFRNPRGNPIPQKLELIRSSEEEKTISAEASGRVSRPAQGRVQPNAEALATGGDQRRERLRGADGRGALLLPRQITSALFEVGGQYRRNM